MKDDINRLLTKHLHTYCDPSINYHSVQGIIPAADELTALMCYREVRAFWVSWSRFSNSSSGYDEACKEVHDYLASMYPFDLIQSCIERAHDEV